MSVLNNVLDTNNILNTSKNFYTYLKYIFYIFLIFTIFTTSKYAPEYLDEINTIIQLFISIFLLIRFNPIFGTNTFDEFDKNIVFDSAFYLLSTSLLIKFLEIFKKRLTNLLQYYKNFNSQHYEKHKKHEKHEKQKK